MKKHLSGTLSALARQHKRAMTDLEDFDAFLDDWQSLVDQSDTGADQLTGIADFESYASAAVQTFLVPGASTRSADDQGLVGSYDCAAIIVTVGGIVRQANQLAETELNLRVGQRLDQGNIAIKPIAAAATAQPKGRFFMMQAEEKGNQTNLMLAISTIGSATQNEQLFLILLMKAPDMTAAAAILADRFNLSKIEREVVASFLNGTNLRDIAVARGRSYTTIRNQFQSVLDKTGCDSQSSLYRCALSVHHLLDKVQVDPARTPQQEQRTMILPRPQGRRVEVLLSGDETGTPIISYSSLFGHGITPAHEARLIKRGILLISIARPGFGRTSPAPKGQSLHDWAAADLRAVSRMMEIPSCPVIARASSSRSVYNMLKINEGFATRCVVVNGMIPRNYVAKKTVSSRWTTALMSASVLSYPVAKLILGTGHRVFKRSDSGPFLTKMYQGSPTDHAAFRDPEVVLSIEMGVADVTRQGVNAGVQEMVDGFCDWSSDLEGLQTPIVLYHGRDDANVPCAGVVEFARDHSGILQVVLEETGGGQLHYSHFDRILDLALDHADTAPHTAPHTIDAPGVAHEMQ